MTSPLTNQELFHFFEQFSIILHSGMSAVEGLALLGEEEHTARGREVLFFLSRDMEESGSLAHALEESHLFPDSAVAYVRAGEETGCLDEVMHTLSAYYEQELQTASQIQSAVTYPLVMLGMMTAVILILLVKVLPVFRQVFRQLGLEPSGASGALFSIGDAIGNSFSVLFILLVFLAGSAVYLCVHPKGKQLRTRLISKIPGFRKIAQALDYSRFCQCMSMGIRSGLSPELYTELASAVVTDEQFSEKLKNIQQLLADGAAFFDALKQIPLFTPMEQRMVSLGFQTGSADEVMEKLAKNYEEQAYGSISRMVSILEPTIVILLSLLVGLILLFIMLPLLSLFSEMIV